TDERHYLVQQHTHQLYSHLKNTYNIFTKLYPLFRNAFVPTSGAGFMFVVGWHKMRVQGEECKRPANWRVCCSRWEEFSCFTHIPQQGCWKCRLRHNLEIF